MFDDGIFGGLFDLDGDGKLDFFEQGLEFMAILRNNLKALIFQCIYAIIYLSTRNSSLKIGVQKTESIDNVYLILFRVIRLMSAVVRA